MKSFRYDPRCLIDTYDSTAVSAISADLSVYQPSHMNFKSSYLLETSVLLPELHNKGLPENKISKINNNNHSQGKLVRCVTATINY